MKDIYLSVIIPCFNEERNIRLGALENVAHFLSKKKWEYEVVIIDDGSTDESFALIKEFLSDHPNFNIIKKKHQGKAAAVITGVGVSKGEIILFTDLDQATPISELDKLLPWFEKKYDMVIGSRNSTRRGAPLLRLILARGFIFLRNIILDLGIKDTQCGFKAFTRQTAGKIFGKLKVFNLNRKVSGSTVTAGFDVELLYLAKLNRLKIAEVPVIWHYQETRHINPIKDSIEGIIDLLQIRLNSIRGVYTKLSNNMHEST